MRADLLAAARPRGGTTSSLGPGRADAACRGAATALFFPDPGDDHSVRKAKAIYASCRVVSDCRAHGLATPAERGIWGGLTEPERQRGRQHGRRGEAA